MASQNFNCVFCKLTFNSFLNNKFCERQSDSHFSKNFGSQMQAKCLEFFYNNYLKKLEVWCVSNVVILKQRGHQIHFFAFSKIGPSLILYWVIISRKIFLSMSNIARCSFQKLNQFSHFDLGYGFQGNRYVVLPCHNG